jgi:predicted cupin superfamily sugar epimerase
LHFPGDNVAACVAGFTVHFANIVWYGVDGGYNPEKITPTGKIMDKQTAEKLIEQLELIRHPEGGWYRETYRSEDVIQDKAVSVRFSGKRSVCTAIYFLLQAGDVSALHRIKSDEIWHFYAGASLTVHVITPHGEYSPLYLGGTISPKGSFQCVVPAGCWFGAEIAGGESYSLVGCTVAPGFDFADFEMGKRDELLREFPNHQDIILRLTKGGMHECSCV